MTIQAAICLKQTCQFLYKDITEFWSYAYHVDRLLLPFFKSAEDIIRFGHMQGQTGAIIAGSIVLKFFMRHQLDSSPLTIYVHYSSKSSITSVLCDAGYWKSEESYNTNQEPYQVPCFPPNRYPGDLRVQAIPKDCDNSAGTIVEALVFKREIRVIEVALVSDLPLYTILTFQTSEFLNLHWYIWGNLRIYHSCTYVPDHANACTQPLPSRNLLEVQGPC
jgi:hypothetical protein